MDACIAALPSLEKLAAKKVDDSINAMVSNCLRMVAEEQESSLDPTLIQGQVDAFIKDDSVDQIGNTPSTLLIL